MSTTTPARQARTGGKSDTAVLETRLPDATSAYRRLTEIARETRRLHELVFALRGEPTLPWALSLRQLETFRLLARGHSREEVALELGVTVAAIKYRTREVLQKLEARNTTHAVAILVAADPDFAREDGRDA